MTDTAGICPDCGRPFATGRQSSSTGEVCDNWTNQGRHRCEHRTVARLRTENANLRAENARRLTEIQQLYEAFRPQQICNPREAQQHIENLRDTGREEALTRLAGELQDREHLEEAARLLPIGAYRMLSREESDSVVKWLTAERARKEGT